MAESNNVMERNNEGVSGPKPGAPTEHWKDSSAYSDPAFNMDSRNGGVGAPQGKVETSSQNEPQCTSENDGPKR